MRDKYGLLSLEIGGEPAIISIFHKNSIDASISRRKRLYNQVFTRRQIGKKIHVWRIE